MSALAAHDGAQRRRANFFRDIAREPEANTAHDALEAQALSLVRASLEADALSNHRDLKSGDMDRMLSVAKGKLRGMSERELRGISASSTSLKALTDYSLSAAPVTDPLSPTALALAAERDKAAGADGGNSITARLLRADMSRVERTGSSNRFGSLGGSEQFSQTDTLKIAAAMSVAREYGMTWMNPRDLLAIGPAGVKAIAQTNLKETGYKALQSSHYSASDVVTFAKHAKIKGFDAQQAALATEALVQAQPANQQKALADVLKAYERASVDAHEKPTDAAAQRQLEEAGQRQKTTLQGIAAQSPEQAERVRKLEETKKVEERFRATAAATDAKTDVKLVKTDAAIADLNEPLPAKTDTPNPNAKATTVKATVVAAPKQ